MVKEEIRKVILLALCTAFAFPACTPQASPGELDDRQVRGIGSRDRLTSAEWATYRSDAQYVHDLAPPDVPVRLNLADPRQYNFAMARLKLAGKNPASSPHLFELLEARRNAQVAIDLKAGVTGGPVAMHYIEAAAIHDGQLVGTASSAALGGTDYTYLDLAISTIAGTPLGNLAFVEEFERPDGNNGANLTVSTTGNPNLSSLTRYEFESYKFEEIGSDIIDSYIHLEIGSRVAKVPVGPPQLSAATVDEPRDTVGPGGGPPDLVITGCLNPPGTNDCDYVVGTGLATDHRVKLPFKGAISLTTPHVFDAAAIEAFKTAPDAPGLAVVVLADAGGGCSAPMSGFWKNVTLSADNVTLSWDVTGSNALHFGAGCDQIQDRVKLMMMVVAPVLSVPGGIPFTTSFTISNDPNTLRPDAVLPALTFTRP